MLCEWVELRGQPWRDHISEWFRDSGCDAWVVRTSTMTPGAYCSARISEMPSGPHDSSSPVYGEWIKYFHERGVNMVHGGVITMRRRPGDNWVQIEEELLTLDHLVGHSIANEFFSRDLLRKSDEELLQERPKLYPGTALTHLFRQSNAAWESTPLKLAMRVTTPRELELDPLVAKFVAKFTGERSLKDLAVEFSQEVNVEPEQVAAECVTVMRKLLEKGFLDASPDS
jgi:hypothetical protein